MIRYEVWAESEENKMKKKSCMILFVTILLVLSLTGCGKNYEKQLLPEDANLSEAPDVKVDEEEEIHCLTNWTEESVVFWDIKIPKDGDYVIEIDYSRPGNYPEANGRLWLQADEGEPVMLDFVAKPTTDETDNWKKYKKMSMETKLTEGEYEVILLPDYAAVGDMPEKFINLRSVTIKEKEK